VALRRGSRHGSVRLEAAAFAVLADVGLPVPTVLAGPTGVEGDAEACLLVAELPGINLQKLSMLPFDGPAQASHGRGSDFHAPPNFRCLFIFTENHGSNIRGRTQKRNEFTAHGGALPQAAELLGEAVDRMLASCAACRARLGCGRIVALRHRSSTSYHTHGPTRCLCF
jgi:hypothetical protein